MGPGSFSGTQQQNRRGNGQKLDQRKFHTKTRKNLFIVKETEHCNRLPRDAVESPSLQTHMDDFLCDLLQGTFFSGVLHLIIFRGLLQPLQFYDSVITCFCDLTVYFYCYNFRFTAIKIQIARQPKILCNNCLPHLYDLVHKALDKYHSVYQAVLWISSAYFTV